MSMKRLREVFDHYDTDGSGSIDLDELTAAFETFTGAAVRRDEVLGQLHELDADHDGRVTFEEFVRLMTAEEDVET